MIALLKALRPRQWFKNSFCLAPLVFAQKALDGTAVVEAGFVVIAFSLIASAVYLTNDVVDRERDRQHPTKRLRPIASGALPLPAALAAAALLTVAGLIIAARTSSQVAALLVGYLALNFAYSVWLKHVVLVDLFVIAIGFVLRVVAGAEAIGVATSSWILICTLFISLFMAACKRRSEVELQGQAGDTRSVLSSYTVRFLDLVITVVAAGAILSYALYTMSAATIEHLGTARLTYTLPFVIFGVFRYIYLVMERTKGESPFELLIGDVAMALNIVVYLFLVMYLVYGS